MTERKDQSKPEKKNMTENVEPRRPMALREKYGRNRGSKAWQDWPEKPPIITFQTGEQDTDEHNRNWHGVPFSKIVSILYEGGSERMTVEAEKIGTFFIYVPKAKLLELIHQLCINQPHEIRA